MKKVLTLLLAAAAVASCGVVRKVFPEDASPMQRYEYRTGQGGTLPAPKPVEEKQAPQKIEKPAEPVRERPQTPATTSLRGHELVTYAKEFLGTPYRYAANGPDHFDCSGFTTYIFKHFGISLPRTSRDQFSVGRQSHPLPCVFLVGRAEQLGVDGVWDADHLLPPHESRIGRLLPHPLAASHEREFWIVVNKIFFLEHFLGEIHTKHLFLKKRTVVALAFETVAFARIMTDAGEVPHVVEGDDNPLP